jgi:hypothetical protein
VKIFSKASTLAIVALLALIALRLYTTKAWGEFKGGDAQSGFAFEDNTGTLRFLTNIPCGGTPLVALEVRRSDTSNGH